MPNGKGVNVSFILKELGIDSTATGFKAGFTGQFIEEELQRQASKHNSLRWTELLVSMFSRKSWTQTKNSNSLTKVQVLHPIKKLLFSAIVENMNADDILFVSGSHPEGITLYNLREHRKSVRRTEV